MIIRATKKLLNTSGIKPVKNLNELDAPLPGEWYAGLVSTGRQGKMLIHFLHSSTKLSILHPGKSHGRRNQPVRHRAAPGTQRSGQTRPACPVVPQQRWPHVWQQQGMGERLDTVREQRPRARQG